jgi:hypothetical protein
MVCICVGFAVLLTVSIYDLLVAASVIDPWSVWGLLPHVGGGGYGRAGTR